MRIEADPVDLPQRHSSKSREGRFVAIVKASDRSSCVNA
jgi:hypothetical protein